MAYDWYWDRPGASLLLSGGLCNSPSATCSTSHCEFSVFGTRLDPCRLLADDVAEYAGLVLHTPPHFCGQHLFGLELLGGEPAGFPGIGVVAARVDIHRSIAVFRPCVNGQVRLRNNDDTANPLRVKAVKCGLEDLRVCFFRGLDENICHFVDVAED